MRISLLPTLSSPAQRTALTRQCSAEKADGLGRRTKATGNVKDDDALLAALRGGRGVRRVEGRSFWAPAALRVSQMPPGLVCPWNWLSFFRGTPSTTWVMS